MVDADSHSLRLHHVGYVVRDIGTVVRGMVDSVAGEWDGQVIHDPLQKVRVTFIRVGIGAQIELVEPADPGSPVTRFLDKTGGGLHHLCYEVGDLDGQLTLMRSRGVMIARPPMPAVAFGGRRIAWVMTRQKLLLELLETTDAADPQIHPRAQ